MSGWGLNREAQRALLSAAVLAPSMHNTQPWRFELGTNTVHVYRDLDRWLREEDPEQAALYLSLGATVLNLRAAAAELGRLAHVTLLPEPALPDYVARVWLATGLGVDAELASLYTYIPRRHTNREPYADRPVPDRALRDLERAAGAEGTTLRVVRDPEGVRRLLGLAAEGATNELHQLNRLEERARWVGGERVADGVPASALGPLPLGHSSLVRDLAVRADDRKRPVATFERDPVLAVLSVRRHDRFGWLTAGQALQRVLLAATRWGLSASFLSQALETEGLRGLVQDAEPGPAHAQMLLRLGYGRPTVTTPRRPLEDFALPSERDPYEPVGGDR